MARAFYLLVATVLGGQGVFYTLRNFPDDAAVGVPLALLAILNGLNGLYGSNRVGLRRTTFGMNVALLALVFWMEGVPDEMRLPFSLVLLLAVAGWSVARRRSRPERPQAAASVAQARRSRWEWLYVCVAGGLVAVGTWVVVDDLGDRGFFYGLGVLVGFAFVLFGTLNLLAWRYGSNVRVMRLAVAAVNVTLLVIIGAVGWFSYGDWHERVMYAWLPAAAVVLSLVPRSGQGLEGLSMFEVPEVRRGVCCVPGSRLARRRGRNHLRPRGFGPR